MSEAKKKQKKASKTYLISSECKSTKEKYADVADQLAHLAYGKSLAECLGHKETLKVAQNYLVGNRIKITLPVADKDSEEWAKKIKNIGSHLTKNKIGFSLVITK